MQLQLDIQPQKSTEYPIGIYSNDGTLIDNAGNIDSAVSILYGDLSYHDGKPRTVYCDSEHFDALEYNAKINADCFGIPIDNIKEWQ